MGEKTSACLYINRKVLQMAKQAGLNVSKVAENGLIEAVRRLNGTELGTGPKNQPNLDHEGRGRDLNPGARLHRPIGYQATSPRPLFGSLRLLAMLRLKVICVFSGILGYLCCRRIRSPLLVVL